MKLNKISDINKSEYYFGLSKDRFISITLLKDKEVALLDFEKVKLRGEDKMVIKFCLTNELSNDPNELELEDKSYYTITKSFVIADRLNKNKSLLPFIATMRQDKYYYYE